MKGANMWSRFPSALRQSHRRLTCSRLYSSQCDFESLKARMNGVLAVYKPTGRSSSQVVQMMRQELELELRKAGAASGSPPRRRKRKPMLKVGHGGTLDPLADGVLVVGVGRGTREMAQYLAGYKRYRAVGMLGAEYNTGDCTGEVIAVHPWQHVTRGRLEEVLPQFTGDIQQVPPMFSALKKDGKRLYELARRGEDVERQPRPVHIADLKLTWGVNDGLALELPYFGLDITCSGGTYIRTLIEDIGKQVGSSAHMTALSRTQQGVFDLEHCLPEKAWQDHEQIMSHLKACEEYLTSRMG